MNSSKRIELIEKIKRLEGITNDERADLLQLLNQTKTYGLVWEEKQEDVEVRLQKELPVLREVKSRAITPLLNSVSTSYPNHTIIEGDNLEALTALSYTHEGKIDVIYIDPPYNTGNKDFIYNDSYVDSEDCYRHSKWLSFMSKRLRIAKRLLSDRGVIFISIDDNEQANLKLLCDEIFGLKNFVCNFIWRGGKRNMSKWVSTSHEYMLLYANNLSYCSEIGVEWFEKKKGIEDIYKIAKSLVKQCNNDFEKASALLKQWFKSLPEDNPSKDHKHYCWIDEIGVYFASDISRGGGGGPQWQITNPKTGEIVKTPLRGWAYSSIEALYEDIKNNLVHFNGNGVPCKKRYLKDNETQILETVFYKDRRASSKKLRDLMGSDAFTFPKDEIILSEKIKSFSVKNSTILDFFAGSGTTLHATMQLNAEDGGTRQCILCTNNENGICENVTYERNKRVINGYTKPNGEAVEGLHGNNLRYYKTDFVSRRRTPQNMRRLMLLSSDMLCIKENLYSEHDNFGKLKPLECGFRYFADDNKQMLIIYNEEAIYPIIEEIERMTPAEPIIIYVFSLGNDAWNAEFESVDDKVRLTALPAAIYNAYKRVLPKPKDEEIFTEETSAEKETDEDLGRLFSQGGNE